MLDAIRRIAPWVALTLSTAIIFGFGVIADLTGVFVR